MLSRLRSAELKIHEVSFGPGEHTLSSQLPFFLMRSAPKDLSSVEDGGGADTDIVRIATLSDICAELCESTFCVSPKLDLDWISIDSCDIDGYRTTSRNTGK